MTPFFECGRFRFPLKSPNSKPLVMGILNVTPDSFSDGGRFQSLDHAISHAEQMIVDGVDIIDIGGESSRPGAQVLPVEEELSRVIPLIYALRDCGIPLSIDTYKPQVMREAIIAGVDMVNDIRGFASPESRAAVCESEVALCVMHMQNTPQNMQIQPQYLDVVQEVTTYLHNACQQLLALGVDKNRLCIDPGFGFGKTLDHNIALLNGIAQMSVQLGLPVLAGLSRKNMIGLITDKAVEQRMAGSLGAAIAAMQKGAKILRVHDVAETVDALKVLQALSK
ncbi:MAG: dihydropteroate synthase [Undibacterium sp.]|nr:dihydropteroate synthase [Undibacterium sp.]